MQSVIIIPNRDYLSARAIHHAKLRSAAAWRKQAVAARKCDPASWRRLMSYNCQCVDEAARYRMIHVERMQLPG